MSTLPAKATAADKEALARTHRVELKDLRKANQAKLETMHADFTFANNKARTTKLELDQTKKDLANVSALSGAQGISASAAKAKKVSLMKKEFDSAFPNKLKLEKRTNTEIKTLT
jgi:hypothetical protein